MMRTILLLMMILALWIQKTESCLKHPPHKPRIDRRRIQEEKEDKLSEEINKRRKMYEEEQNQLLQEPEFFIQDDTNC